MGPKPLDPLELPEVCRIGGSVEMVSWGLDLGWFESDGGGLVELMLSPEALFRAAMAEEYMRLRAASKTCKGHAPHGPCLRPPSDDHSHKSVNHEALVEKVTAHHKDCYIAKWAAVHEDVLASFSPPSRECLSMDNWLEAINGVSTGRHRPGDTFTRCESRKHLSEDQLKKIEVLRGKIRVEEEKVEGEMERQHVAMTDRRMVDLARLASRIKGGDSATTQVDGLVEGALKGLLGGLERVMKMADCVRLKTLKAVLEVLSLRQCVDFLSAKLMLQIQLRKWGKKREKISLKS
ncbi:unnamed protein product [Ilex paraguariensis]|uniref:DOG1 domain-containing protein n=2 Tax=Ilex paraguariensis TaxID=185542 RepID=A0ABC8SDP8_9AQUA